MNISAAAFARETGARTIGDVPQELEISTDTRTLVPGATFLALRGASFDGHAFVAEAFARGAAAAVVADASVVAAGAPAFVVADTLAAYLGAAAVARRASAARVVAITGSTGKTTTKALLAGLLERLASGPVVATPANENNEVGVGKLFTGLREDAAYVVAEFGARHYGDIAPLASVAAADVAVLTNVGDAHLEIMGSRERLAETKWGIFTPAPDRPPPLAILNAADATSRARAAAVRERALWFAVDAAAATEIPAAADAVVLDGATLRTRRSGVATSVPFSYALAGAHNRANLAAAIAAAFALGFAPAKIAAAVPHLRLPEGRYERRRLADAEAIFDAYNASTDGMLAALASFAAEPAGRRIAVLASMAELGPQAPAMHERVGAAAAGAGLAFLLAGGDYAEDIVRGARSAGMDDDAIVPFADNAAAAAWLRANVRSGDLVLFKGSRKYRLEDALALAEAVRA